MEHCRRKAPQAIIVCLILVLAGCGETGDPSTIVQGNLTKGGAPLQVDKQTHGGYAGVTITFQQLNESSGQVQGVYAAAVDDDGNFQKEMPPGKYRISVIQFEGKGNDLLGGQFSLEDSPIEREIEGATQQLSIDLDNP